VREVIKSPTGVELLAGRDVPESFDWRLHGGRNWVTPDVNQHIPQYCGACWIHGTTAHLNDRLKIMRHAAFPDVMLSRQSLLNCVPGFNDTAPPGCNGGESILIYDYLMETPVPDETCQIWKAKTDECVPYNVCRNCDLPDGFLEAADRGEDTSSWDFEAGCFAVPNFLGYQITEHGAVKGAENMMREIYARGPISCGMAAPDPFMYNYSEIAAKHEGVFFTTENNSDSDHVIEIAGWGVTNGGLEYWIGRNSWGTYWGQDGWFKIAKGINLYVVEADCTWALPKANDIDGSLHGKILGDYMAGIHPVHLTSEGETPEISEVAELPAQGGMNSLPAFFATLSLGALGGYLAPRRERLVMPEQLLG